jgi:hypothetical protein
LGKETKGGNRYAHAHFSDSVRPKTAQASFLLAKQVPIQVIEIKDKIRHQQGWLNSMYFFLIASVFWFCTVHPQNYLYSADSTQDHQKQI